MKAARSLDCCAPDGRSRALPGTAAQARAVAVFKALGDSARLQIFGLIAARPEPICVCDIVPRFKLRQPTISHHLKVLRDAGLVTMTRRGVWSYYAVDPRGARAARAAFDALVPAAPGHAALAQAASAEAAGQAAGPAAGPAAAGACCDEAGEPCGPRGR